MVFSISFLTPFYIWHRSVQVSGPKWFLIFRFWWPGSSPTLCLWPNITRLSHETLLGSLSPAGKELVVSACSQWRHPEKQMLNMSGCPRWCWAGRAKSDIGFGLTTVQKENSMRLVLACLCIKLHQNWSLTKVLKKPHPCELSPKISGKCCFGSPSCC